MMDDELQKFADSLARIGVERAAAPSVDNDTGKYGVMWVDSIGRSRKHPVFAAMFIPEDELEKFIAFNTERRHDPVCVELVGTAAARIPQYRAEKEN